MNLLHRWQHYFRNLSVRRKLNLLTLLIALGVIALSVIAARMQYLDLTETRKSALKTQVELSYGILQHYHRLAGTGELSEEAAKSAALQALEVMRAGNDTYYFNIYDTGYRLLMHPFRKDLVGKDMKDFRTDDGVRIYYDQVEAARAGGALRQLPLGQAGQQGRGREGRLCRPVRALELGGQQRRLHGRRAETGAGVHRHHGGLWWRTGADRAGPELGHRQPHRRAAEAGHRRGRRHRRRQAGQPHRPAAARRNRPPAGGDGRHAAAAACGHHRPARNGAPS
jgi:hypothetical protein